MFYLISSMLVMGGKPGFPGGFVQKRCFYAIIILYFFMIVVFCLVRSFIFQQKFCSKCSFGHLEANFDNTSQKIHWSPNTILNFSKKVSKKVLKRFLWTRRMQFDNTSQKFFAQSSKLIEKKVSGKLVVKMFLWTRRFQFDKTRDQPRIYQSKSETIVSKNFMLDKQTECSLDNNSQKNSCK